MIARILTLLAAAIKASQAAPGYTYKGTINLTGSWLVGTTVHTSLTGAKVGLVVGALVGLVVGALVGLVVGALVGALVAALVGALVGLVVEAVGGAVVGLVVGAVVGLVVGAVVGLVVGALVEGVDDPPKSAPESIKASGTMLEICKVTMAPEVEVKRRVRGVTKALPVLEEADQYPQSLLGARAEKEEEEASFTSILTVCPLSFLGCTASHQMLLDPNTCKLTVEACSAFTRAHPNNIATKSKNDKDLLYIIKVLQLHNR